jgi:hypothetical protein
MRRDSAQAGDTALATRIITTLIRNSVPPARQGDRRAHLAHHRPPAAGGAHRGALTMRAWLVLSALALQLVPGPAAAQPQPPAEPPSVQLPAEPPKPAGVEPVPLPAEPPPLVEKPAPESPPPMIERSNRRGECIIKPVMSDEDLLNCGATPRQPVLPK